MDSRIVAACLLVELSALVAMADGLYFHLWKYRLFARPESAGEHLSHTLRSVLFGPMVYLLFAKDFGGPVLLGAALLVLVDFAVESWDVFVERDSRAALGGLTPLEYWLHVVAITTHVAAVTIVLSTKPASAWSLSAPNLVAGSWPRVAGLTALLLVPGALGVAALHLWLLQPKYRRAGAAAPAP